MGILHMIHVHDNRVVGDDGRWLPQGARARRAKARATTDIKGNGNDWGKGMKGKGKCNDITGNGNDGGKGNDDGGRLVTRGIKRRRA